MNESQGATGNLENFEVLGVKPFAKCPQKAIDNNQNLIDDEPQEEASQVIYDADAKQTIPLKIEKGGKLHKVEWEMNPISDEEFFVLMEAMPENAKRIGTLSVELLAPYAEIGKKKAISRKGYKERADWRDRTHPHDYISIVQAYLTVAADNNSFSTDELLDDEAETAVTLISSFNKQKAKTVCYFAEEKQADIDEFLAALNNEPPKNALASAVKESKERRIYKLYKKLNRNNEGYASRVPAWHAIEAVSAFLNGQLIRLGKSLQ